MPFPGFIEFSLNPGNLSALRDYYRTSIYGFEASVIFEELTMGRWQKVGEVSVLQAAFPPLL